MQSTATWEKTLRGTQRVAGVDITSCDIGSNCSCAQDLHLGYNRGVIWQWFCPERPGIRLLEIRYKGLGVEVCDSREPINQMQQSCNCDFSL